MSLIILRKLWSIYVCHSDMYLSFRHMFVIPTEAEESCHFLILLMFHGMRSLRCGRDDTTAVEMTIDQSFHNNNHS